jgi:hypothetical protein
MQHSSNTISVVVASYPAQQFWLVYSFDCASFPAREHEDYAPFYVFKVYLNQKEITTFHVGPEQEWKGKCMFGMHNSHGKLGRDVFVFEPGVGEVEVKVFRGAKKARVPRGLVSLGDVANDGEGGGKKVGKGVRRMGGGLLGNAAPKRGWFYQLRDELERPWVIVRFLCWEKGEFTVPWFSAVLISES